MRYIWLIFGGLVVAMLVILPRLAQHKPTPATTSLPAQQVAYYSETLLPAGRADVAKADSIVAFGLAQRGTPYVWAGTSPITGFDCSGFIMYTFAHFGVSVPHSTALLIDVGRPVARADAQPGDIVVFTGTDKTSTTPGHAGIVISPRGELPLRFVHASSSRREPFVKVNQVEASDYERRFMQVRRVLGDGSGGTVSARPKVPYLPPAAMVRPATEVAAIPARVVTLANKSSSAAPLPKRLAKRPLKRVAVVRKPLVVRKAKPAVKAAAPRKAAAKPAVKPRRKTTVRRHTASTKATTVLRKPVKR